MNIIYSQTNNICYEDNIGSIIIQSIEFDESEFEEYSSYTIAWSGDIDDNTVISSDGRSASSLTNGNYTFKVVSLVTSSESDSYNITITSLPELIINNISYTEYSCGADAKISMLISGGEPPYSCVSMTANQGSSDNVLIADNLIPGSYQLIIIDNNGCSYTHPETITIKDASVFIQTINIQSPYTTNGYANIKISIEGLGPFLFDFYDKNTDNHIYVDFFETKYIQSIIDKYKYTYLFTDLLKAGEYSLTVTSVNNCADAVSTLNVPGIASMGVSANIVANTNSFITNVYNETVLPIFDTILIPFKFIQNSSNLWQFIKKKKLGDYIEIIIDDTLYNFKIVRNMLDKYGIDDGNIEMLRLGNTSDDWFYYFHIAPSINFNTDSNLLDSAFYIKTDTNNERIYLGLDDNRNINVLEPSLIRGSFILNGLGYSDINNGVEILVNLQQPEDSADGLISVRNIKRYSLLNMYSVGFVTAFGFLEQFNVINNNISNTTCYISSEDHIYILNIVKLLKLMNNFTFMNSIYIHNPEVVYDGFLNLNILGNSSFPNTDMDTGSTTWIDNEYDIKYYYLPNKGNQLLSIYKGSDIIEDITSLSYIKNGFYIVRIKDKYNNQLDYIFNSDKIVSYNNHYTEAKQTIQSYNEKLLDQFLYGDMLVYVGSEENEVIENQSIPSINPNFNTNTLPVSVGAVEFDIFKQTEDTTNTGSIEINRPQNIDCYITGPKNFFQKFSDNIKFTNLIPGLYKIYGDNDQLKINSLYQNEIRVFIDKNSAEKIYLEFVSFKDQIFIKGNNT